MTAKRMTNLSPIVLFVYNRPWHTRQTLEALSKNILADQSKLYIYADGAKEKIKIICKSIICVLNKKQ
ncbi:MAG: hypothetical protein WC868_12750 [Bacteroidales bacterium]